MAPSVLGSVPLPSSLQGPEGSGPWREQAVDAVSALSCSGYDMRYSVFPSIFCILQYNYCTTLYDLHITQLFPSVQGPQCALCELVMKEVENLIQQNSTEVSPFSHSVNIIILPISTSSTVLPTSTSSTIFPTSTYSTPSSPPHQHL